LLKGCSAAARQKVQGFFHLNTVVFAGIEGGVKLVVEFKGKHDVTDGQGKMKLQVADIVI
jgi:hypothetical protein